MKGYADIADLPEDDRIALMAKMLKENPLMVVGVCTDDEPGKPERYIAKLKAACPNLVVHGQSKGPVDNVVTIRVSYVPDRKDDLRP